jgi:hypothetical protein
MDLNLFHPKEPSKANLKVIDRWNSHTGYIHCQILEWTGWYNLCLANRLLGHYRLFQIFKQKNSSNTTDLSLERSYILHHRALHGVNYFLVRCTAWYFSIFSFGYAERNVEIQTINRQLLHEASHILQQFLTDSENDFDKAFLNAMEQIRDNRFPYAHIQQPASRVFVQLNEEHLHHTNLSKNEFHVHPVIKEQPAKAAQGKEKDVFSKKQILIVFDLLAENGKFERIDWEKPRRFEAISELMQALTGKPKSSWQEMLKDYTNKDLYDFNTPGERQELINTLTNLAEKFRKAGFRKIAEIADRKILQIESRQ